MEVNEPVKIANTKVSKSSLMLKLGQVKLQLEWTKTTPKLKSSLHNQTSALHSSVEFTRVEEDEARLLEAERNRNQGQVYASITPIR